MNPDANPVLDKTEAIAICSGDEELFLEMAAIFLIDAEKNLEKLKQALATSDAKGVEETAHAIKGIAANICASPVKDAAHQLQTAARSENFSQFLHLFENLQKEYSRLREYIKQIIPS